ncbi:MAG: Ig-like domain-containing protein [Gemmatimonadales bacterium]
MTRWAGLLLLAAAACSGLEEGEGGVVGLEIQFPELRTLEIGEQVQLSARALDADGDVVEAPITWRATTAAVGVDATGLVTAVAEGSSEVQAVVGSLASERVGFTVVLRADTLIIQGDSVLVIPLDVDPPATATLTVRLESFDPAGPVASRPVIFEIVQPVAGETPVVQLVGGVQGDTVTTVADGLASVVLGAVAGQIPPDTAIVEIRANRTRGAPVPGSGQRFIVLFQ